VPSKPESPITLVVRRGALRRFNKLQKDTKDLPVVVRWDRRSGDAPADRQKNAESRPFEERRKQPSFTWELADFLVVTGDESTDEAAVVPAEDQEEPEAKVARRR
jgi:hypothetical protein